MKKILVIQLARFGDVFISWPTLRALRRNNPTAEIHCLVRSRFKAALEGCESIDRIWTLETAQILRPLVDYSGTVTESLIRLTEFTELLHEQDFDEVINLSFSPFSSYLTSMLHTPGQKVRGYTRFEDGYLSIPDDTSAYFYAQVGIGRYNRYHLGEIFAAVAGMELEARDWSFPNSWRQENGESNWESRIGLDPYVVVHLGASHAAKVYPAFKWKAALKEIFKKWTGKVVLVGAESEAVLAREATSEEFSSRTINLMGQTSFADVAALIAQAKLLIGGDSAPMHLASFTETPCLNLSFAGVNFWETGPRTMGSRILFARNPDELPSDRVSLEALSMLSGQDSGLEVIQRDVAGVVGYRWINGNDQDFAWRLINAIYSGGEWPVVEDRLLASGMWQMREATRAAMAVLENLNHPQRRAVALRIVENSDLAIAAIGKVVPPLQPLVSWFETEKIRQGPNRLENLIQEYARIYGQLDQVLNLYLPEATQLQEANP